MSEISTAEAIEIVRRAREIAGHSPQTAKLDAWMLKAIGKPPGEATLADLEAVVLRNKDRGSRSTYAARLRSVYEILNKAGAIDNKAHLGLPRLPAPKRSPRPFSDAQVDRLMAELEQPYKDVVRFALVTGARSMEVWAVEGQHLIEGAEGALLILNGKGGTICKVPAHPVAVEIMNSRMTLGRIFDFADPAQLSRTLSIAIRDVLGPGHNFHQCRHTFGTRVYRNTKDILLTSQLMRHSTLQSTLIYAQVCDDAPRAAVLALTA
jgi:integrase